MSKEVKDFSFDKQAAKYDDRAGKISNRFYSLLLQQVELFLGAVVLDMGCGTGTVLRRMADSCEIIGYGIDAEENMVAEARQKCPDMNIQISRCEDTPFENQYFDVITVCMAYHHFADRAGFAKEAARLLKPGGRLYIADPRLPFIIRKILNGLFKLVNVAGHFDKPQELYGHFGEYGFEPVGFVINGYAQVTILKNNGK
jgi:ubiquinone/menaquinone biosynthesis C-methylase UbiE